MSRGTSLDPVGVEGELLLCSIDIEEALSLLSKEMEMPAELAVGEAELGGDPGSP